MLQPVCQPICPITVGTHFPSKGERERAKATGVFLHTSESYSQVLGEWQSC